MTAYDLKAMRIPPLLLLLGSCFLSSCSSFSYEQGYDYPPDPKLYSATVGFTGVQRVPGGFIGGEAWFGQVVLYKGTVQKAQYAYPLKAANLDDDASWTRPGTLTIHFYDYPDGLNIGDKDEIKLRKLLATHRYRYDQHAGAFVELPHGE